MAANRERSSGAAPGARRFLDFGFAAVLGSEPLLQHLMEPKKMAQITKADVEYVASLAQLSLDEDVKERLVKEMGDILGYIDQLNGLDTEGIEPTMHALSMVNVFREDEEAGSISREEALANAPEADGEYFLVPKILDTE